jgi:hypothetical protein
VFTSGGHLRPGAPFTELLDHAQRSVISHKQPLDWLISAQLADFSSVVGVFGKHH